jgi:putative glycosyltransferase (TIGR04372 family)
MKNIVKKILKKILVRTPVGKLILSISKWQSSPFLPLRWLGLSLIMPLYWLLKDKYYGLLIFLQHDLNKKLELPQSSRIPSFFIRALMGDQSATAEKYARILEKTVLQAEIQYAWAHRFLANGRLDLARIGFLDLINRKKNKLSADKQLEILRVTGAVCFMMGRNTEANYYWQLAGKFRRMLFKPTTPTGYRILGSAWFVAIGHIAMLDYYLKFKNLHDKENQRIVAEIDMTTIPNRDLLDKFLNLGIVLLAPGQLENDYNTWAQQNNYPRWNLLSSVEKTVLVDDFWEFDFPDGEILGYAHAAARIQREWEHHNQPPLFIVNETEKRWLKTYLVSLGVPENAWYVCLHVREGGFHQQWNALYPTMRDAIIHDYYSAIEHIVKAGGWVIRMGDSSMKPLPTMPNVIDYAHSPFKTACADILLAASCRFFLGTNSGFATISAIYKVPCALSNWVPVGWPLWPTQDLMIPKLFRDKTSGQFLTLEQIFERGVAFIQNWSDLPENIELVANTPEEIRQLTIEMLSRCKIGNPDEFIKSGTPLPAKAYYFHVANHYNAFTGSELARTFVEKYPQVFSSPEADLTHDNRGNKITWHTQSNDNMTVTLN